MSAKVKMSASHGFTNLFLLIALVATALYLYWVPLALCSDEKCSNGLMAYLATLEPQALGSVLAGVFSPVAFLWLICGYIMQAIELRSSIGEMKASNEALSTQVKSIQNTESLNKRDLFFKYYDVLSRDMDAHAKAICRELFNSQFTLSIGRYTNDNFKPSLNDVRHMMLMCRKLVSHGKAIQISKPELVGKVMAELEAFCGAYKTLEDQAKKLDESGELEMVLTYSAYGEFFKVCTKTLECLYEIKS